MNVVASIDPNVLKEIFGWESPTIQTIIDMVKNRSVQGIKTYDAARKFTQEKVFFDICEFMFDQTAKYETSIQTEIINNPFRDWQRVGLQNLFQKGGRREHIPDGKISSMLNPDKLYVVRGYKDSGTYANIFTFVVYKGKKCVLKVMEDDMQPNAPTAAAQSVPRYIHTTDMYEIVSQTFMHQICKKYAFVSVPQVLAARAGSTSSAQNLATPLYVIMERAKGKELNKVDIDQLPLALALLVKSLFLLQKEVHFMHRDLHGRNVFYDNQQECVHIIDFGMSCINPGMDSIAWQGQQWFFPILEESRNARCDNPSLDVCCIVSGLALLKDASTQFGQFLKNELQAMKAAAKHRIERIKNCQTVQEMLNDNSDFTRIRTRGWQMGNKSAPNTNYWVYELGQIDLIRWYPEHMLARLLPYVPLEKWNIVRQSIENVFDVIAPKLRVKLTDGREGTLQKIQNQEGTVNVDGGDVVVSRLNSLTVLKTITV